MAVLQNAIGKVTATEQHPTSCRALRFWVRKDVVIRPFDFIKVKHIRDSYTYAIVTDLTYITDSGGHLADYASSDFGDVTAKAHNTRLGTTIADAEILYNDKEIEMPVHEGALVEWADLEGIQEALGMSRFRSPIPAGYFTMSNGTEVPIAFDAPYLIGPEGAHLNIAGISGLATKTSYAMFLLNSIQQRIKDKVTMILFNVKGADLLSIDRRDPNLSTRTVRDWQKCGLVAEPFQNVAYLYPYSSDPRKCHAQTYADKVLLKDQIVKGQARNFIYDIERGLDRLGLILSDIDDSAATMESILHQLQSDKPNSWDALKEAVAHRTQAGLPGNKDIPVASWRKFSRLIETRIDNDIFTEPAASNERERRQIEIYDAIKGLSAGQVLVIDIAMLPDYLQCLVVGDVIQTIYSSKLGSGGFDGRPLGTIVMFADELNKYAPKGVTGSRTLTDSLLDVTERGRSLGVVLFGAEQFRSGVHDRILGNCSTNVYGRTSPVEIAKCGDYHYFNDNHKSSLIRLHQGSLLLQHAVYRTALIKAEFPYPCYAKPDSTRGDSCE